MKNLILILTIAVCFTSCGFRKNTTFMYSKIYTKRTILCLDSLSGIIDKNYITNQIDTIDFDSNRLILGIGKYKINTKIGSWVFYDLRQNYRIDLKFKNNKVNGKVRFYNVDGWLVIKAHFKNGVLDKRQVYYNPYMKTRKLQQYLGYLFGGNLTYIRYYNNGKIVNGKSYRIPSF